MQREKVRQNGPSFLVFDIFKKKKKCDSAFKTVLAFLKIQFKLTTENNRGQVSPILSFEKWAQLGPAVSCSPPFEKKKRTIKYRLKN